MTESASDVSDELILRLRNAGYDIPEDAGLDVVLEALADVRMTRSELLESVQQSSIKISQNAKGDRSFEVKVYLDDPDAMTSKLDRYLGIATERIKAPEGE